MSLYLFVVFPLFAALLGYLFSNRLSKSLIFLVQFVLFIMAILNFIEVRTNGPVLEVLGKYPLGVGISLKADIISSVLILLTVFLFSCLLLYNHHKTYMNHLFLFLFLILQGLLCGLFLSNDLFNIYVLVEVSTIIVSVLIIFKKDSKSIYDGMIYLLTNLASMTLFLLALGYLYRIFGTLDLTLLAQRIPEVSNPRTLIIPFALLITAVDLKAAIMPLFSWLPKAHGTASAPSIISATLSGLYVKSGVYIFIRIIDLFQP
ncbi:MAG: proton-conducting membrane transporter, partial [Vallitaleaceae bacterium]|nr:proton-conducting membrane transporter [Vallitaleaceae bacterium]